MSEQSEAIVATTHHQPREHGDPLAGVRQLAYAWVGMWGVASDDLGNFYQRCVARGEQILNAKPPAAQPEVKPPAPDAGVTRRETVAPRSIRPMSVFNAFGAVESYHIDLNVDRDTADESGTRRFDRAGRGAVS